MGKVKFTIIMILALIGTLFSSMFIAISISKNSNENKNVKILNDVKEAIKNGDNEKAKNLCLNEIKFNYSDELIRNLVKLKEENSIKEKYEKSLDLIKKENYNEALKVLKDIEKKLSEANEKVQLNLDIKDAIKQCEEKILDKNIVIIKDNISKNNFKYAKDLLDKLSNIENGKEKVKEISNLYENKYKDYEENQKKLEVEKKVKENKKISRKKDVDDECDATEENVKKLGLIIARDEAKAAYPNMKYSHDGDRIERYDSYHKGNIMAHNFIFKSKENGEYYNIFVLDDKCIEARHAPRS